MQMAATMGESLGIPCDIVHTHACVCAHMHGGCTHSPTLKGLLPRISKNLINLEGIEIFQFCLKILNLW